MDVLGKSAKYNSLLDQMEEASAKSSARKRLETLFDEGSFVEIGAFVKKRPTEFNTSSDDGEGVVTGYGAVDGNLVFAFAQDSAVLKGSVSEMHAQKICNIIDMAYKAEAPIVSMIDSNGIRLSEGIDALCGYGKVISKFNELVGNILHVSIVFGTCAGAFSFVPAIADYTIMLKNAELFLSSPDVVNSRFGTNAAGTSATAYSNGMVSAVCENEQVAIEKAIRFIKAIEEPSASLDDINRLVPELDTILAEENYDVKKVIAALADDGDALYMSDGNAKNIVTALIRMNNSLVGVVANQPAEKNGVLDSASAKKACRFLGFCNDFEIAVLSLVDTEGFEASKDENIEDCALLINAFTNIAVPKVSLVLGKAYGAGYLSMCSKVSGADLCLALPTAEIASLSPVTGGVFFADDALKKAKNPIKAREQAIVDYKELMSSPYEAAKRGYIDDIIEPLTARQLLISSFEMLACK